MRVARLNGWFWRFCVTFASPEGKIVRVPATPFWRIGKAREFAIMLADQPELEGCRVFVLQRDGMSRNVNGFPLETYYGRKRS